jgi:UDPglucose 6-dehydrogenase
LRQGSALADFRTPHRLVLGGPPQAVDRVLDMLAAAVPDGTPVVRTDPATAALAKLAANAMLAVRVSLGNELLRLATALGADHGAVLEAIGHDPRIGRAHLQPSLGFGGGCLPKDARMLAATGVAVGSPTRLVAGAIGSNDDQLGWVCAALAGGLDGLDGRRIAVWGAAFKAGTDDLRGSRSAALIAELRAQGAVVRVHDPVAVGDDVVGGPPADVVDGADALVVGTPWPVYGAVDPGTLRPARRWALDPAGALARGQWREAGFSLWPP